MNNIITQFFGNASGFNNLGNDFQAHKDVSNPYMPRKSFMNHRKSSSISFERPKMQTPPQTQENLVDRSGILKANARNIMQNPEDKSQIDIMNVKLNNLQQKQEQENRELLDVIKKSIELQSKNQGVGFQPSPYANSPAGLGVNPNPMGVYSSVRPVNYGNIPQHPMFNPFFMPQIPQVEKFNEYEAPDTPIAKRRKNKSMQLEELNENIELMQEEINRNISKLIL